MIPRVRNIEELSERAHGKADWRPVEGLYEQISEILDDDEAANKNIPPNVMLGQLAERLERISASYTGSEEELVWDALGVLMSHSTKKLGILEAFQSAYGDKRFEGLEEYKAKKPRRRPRPFEAIVETSRRLRDLGAIRKALSMAGGNSAILGGSTSYGRFFNVKGNAFKKKASDVDLLVVLRDWENSTAIESLRGVVGVSSKGLDAALERVSKFDRIRQQIALREKVNSADVAISFSHKLAMWSDSADQLLNGVVPSNYNLSLHIVDVKTFGRIILEEAPVFQANTKGFFHNKIFDYRQEKPEAAHTQRSFDGQAQSPPVDLTPVEEGGFITAREACFIREDRYFPGFHQNLILPQFEIRWEDDEYPLEFRLDAFRWKVIERLRCEKATKPFRLLRLSFSHTRSFEFAPHVARKVDGG